MAAPVTAEEDEAVEAAEEEAVEEDEEESPCPRGTTTFATTNWTSLSASTTTASLHSHRTTMTMISDRLLEEAEEEVVVGVDLAAAIVEVVEEDHHVDAVETETADQAEVVKRTTTGETKSRRF